MVEDCAKEGNGQSYIILSMATLKENVIDALQKASEQSLSKCKI